MTSSDSRDSVEALSQSGDGGLLGKIKDHEITIQNSPSTQRIARPEPSQFSYGHNLGLYSFTRWLHNTNSLDLTLITRMLGFGLLGSAVSSFVRKQVRTGKIISDPIVDSVFVILMTGISAAVVVYLGVLGGLDAVMDDRGKINPYALFFTCLVAAVFSDLAWEWAVNRFDPERNTSDSST